MSEATGMWAPHRLREFAALALVCAVYLAGSMGRAVIDSDEGIYVQAAANMLERGDWVTPWVNGVRFLDKPPLLYWLLAASFKLFGLTEFAVRVPGLLLVTTTAWALMRMVRLAAGETAAAFAGPAWALSPGVFLFTREVMHDGLLVFFFTLAIYAFLAWYLDPKHPSRYALLYWSALAGAMLSKSLIGVLLPCATVLLFLTWQRELPLLRRFAPWRGMLLLLALTAPWHVLVALRNDGFLRHFFLNEQFLRFLGRREPLDYSSIGLGLFWLLFLAWVFPWSCFLPFGFVRALGRRGTSGALDPQTALARLGIAWSATVMFFFSLGSRLEHYCFPALGGAVIAAVPCLFPRSGLEPSRSVRKTFGALAAFAALVLAAALVGGVYFAGGGERLFSDSANAASSLEVYDTDFGPLLALPAEVRRQLLWPLSAVVAALVFGLTAAWRWESQARRVQAALSLVSTTVVFCLAAQFALLKCEDLISSKSLGLALRNFWRAGDRLIVDGDYEAVSSLQFYVPAFIEITRGRAYTLEEGMRQPGAPPLKLSQEQVRELWSSQRRVFLVTTEEGTRILTKGEGMRIAAYAGRQLLCNHCSLGH